MMKHEQERSLTEKIESMNDDSYNPTQEHIEEVLRRTHAELLRREQLMNERKAKRKSRLRRVVVVFAVTVGLMVGTFLYGALAPVTVSKANNILRRASIWVNDTLHLGLEVSQPTDNEESGFTTGMKTEFDTVEEAAKALKTPIAYLGDAGSFYLDNVKVDGEEGVTPIVTVNYSDKNKRVIQIISTPVYEENEAVLKANAQNTVETKIGTAYLSETEAGLMGLAIYQNRLIIIKTTLEEQEVALIVQSLTILN